MAKSKPSAPEIRRHLRFVHQLSRWFERAGVTSAKTRAHLAVDLADSLFAAGEIERLIDKMLDCNPATRRGADRALRHAGNIDALAFTEIKDHVRSLQRVWAPQLMKRLASTADGAASAGTAA